MKSPLTEFAALYAQWWNTGWTLLTGRSPAPQEPTPKAAQAAADQEWEAEGGRVKPKPPH